MSTEECEYSKPYFDGSVHYRKCLASVGGCGETGWKHNYLLCPTRKRALAEELPFPTPEELKPDDMRIKLTRTIWQPEMKQE